jgi:predicted transcriptional regulator
MPIDSVFAALGSETRLSILQQLSQESKRFNALKNDLNLTSPEIVRQLERLRGAHLITKERSGSYAISHLGQIVLFSSENLEFVAEHSDYFRNHDPSPVPGFLLHQLEPSMEVKVVAEKFGPLSLVMEKGNSIREYYWIISDSIPKFVLPQVKVKIGQGVCFRAIYPRLYFEKVKPTLDGEIIRNTAFRVVESIRIVVCVTDAFAYFCLPRFREREIDRTSFMFSSNSSFMTWCGDLFEYYWKRSTPR